MVEINFLEKPHAKAAKIAKVSKNSQELALPSISVTDRATQDFNFFATFREALKESQKGSGLNKVTSMFTNSAPTSFLSSRPLLSF